jgi:DNA-binding response OmpR family regulator
MNLQALKSLTILYIEDEPLIRQNAVEYLSRYCKNVLEAKDGKEGYAAYKEHSPDLIISDIKMPKLSGLELATKIRQSNKHIPIILATEHTETEYLLKAIELHLIKYIIKPITADKLHEALALACNILKNDSVHIILLNDTIKYDTLNKTLIQDNTPLNITYNEIIFFDFLIKNRQRTITYKEIENLIWSYEGMSMDALRSLVRGLRKKLSGDFIKNVSGVGYRIKVLT